MVETSKKKKIIIWNSILLSNRRFLSQLHVVLHNRLSTYSTKNTDREHNSYRGKVTVVITPSFLHHYPVEHTLSIMNTLNHSPETCVSCKEAALAISKSCCLGLSSLLLYIQLSGMLKVKRAGQIRLVMS